VTDHADRLALEPHDIKTPDQQIEYWYGEWETAYDELGQQINATNGAYRERAHLVALLAALYPSTWNYGDASEPGWVVVYVELPTGQCSWHVGENDLSLFEHVERDDSTIWDGHTTPEKYQRIARLAAAGGAS
jgi:hypothetical protein